MTRHFDKARNASKRHTVKKLTKIEDDNLTDDQREARQKQLEVLRNIRKHKLVDWLTNLIVKFAFTPKMLSIEVPRVLYSVENYLMTSSASECRAYLSLFR